MEGKRNIIIYSIMLRRETNDHKEGLIIKDFRHDVE